MDTDAPEAEAAHVHRACACAGGGRAGCSRKDFYYRRMIQVGFRQCDAKGLKQRFDNLEEK